MSKRVWLGVGGGLLLALGLIIGLIVGPSFQALAAGSHPTAAKTAPTPQGYCQLYEQTVINDLGVSQQDLEKANKDAAQAVINKMAADGKITRAQQARAQQQLDEYANNPCTAIQAAMQAKSGAHAPTSGQTQAVTDVRAAILTAVAGAMHIPSATLQSELSAGKTVAQITSEQGASKSAVDAAYLNAAKAQLSKAVSAGKLTQAQADMGYSVLQQSVASGHYPLLDANGDSFGAGMPAGLPAGMMSGQ